MAERWRTQQARLVQATASHEGISGSKMDERAAWLQRLDRQQEQEQQFKPKREARVNNASKLLAQRGFTNTGTLERPVDSDEEGESPAAVSARPAPVELQPAGPARRAGDAVQDGMRSRQDVSGVATATHACNVLCACLYRAFAAS